MTKRLLLFFLLLFLGSSMPAQTFKWAQGWGMEPYTDDLCMTTDQDGNVYVGGYFHDSIPYSAANGGGMLTADDGLDKEGYILKYDSLGNLVWHLTLGGDGHDEIVHLAVDQDQNVWVTGQFSGPFDIDPGLDTVMAGENILGPRPYLIKLDPNGNLLWHHRFTFFPYDQQMVEVDAAGNVYLAGKSYVEFDADPGSNQHLLPDPGINYESVFLIKLDPQGDFQWALSTVAKKVNQGFITVQDDGHTVIYGSIEDTEIWMGSANGTSAHKTSVGTRWNRRSFIQKVTPDGALQWGHLWNSKESNQLTAVSIDTLGNIYCHGGYLQRFDMDPGPGSDSTEIGYLFGSGAGTSYMIKLNPTGNYVWGRSIQGVSSLTPRDVEVTEQGGILFIGTTIDSVDLDPGPLLNWHEPDQGTILNVVALSPQGDLMNVWTTANNPSYEIPYFAAEYLPGKGLFILGEASPDIDLDPGPGVGQVSLPNYTGSSYNFLCLWDLELNGFRLVMDSFAHPTCLDSGFATWHAVNGTPPISYSWDWQPLGTDSSVQFSDQGTHFLHAVDSNGWSTTRRFHAEGPLDPFGIDLRANLVPVDLRPGTPALIHLDVSNQGCLPVSGEIFLHLDTALTFLSSSPSPDRTSNDTLFWDLQQWNYDSGAVQLPVWVVPDTFAQLGQEVCLDLGVTIVQGDLNQGNNLIHHCQELINSYDPNDIHVYPGGACEEGFVLSDQTLTYTIRFQNTGNAPALNIEIWDSLPLQLDISTLNVLSHSHPNLTVELLPGNVVGFLHPGIMLPDSFTDEPGSHGFIIFQIDQLPYNELPGTMENRAAIFFDFNDPVITNTVLNTAVDSIPACESGGTGDPTDPPDITSYSNEFQVYPNPNSGEFTLNWTGDQPIESLEVEVYSSLGQLVFRQSWVNFQTEVLHLEQPNGLYYLFTNRTAKKEARKILIRK